MKFLRYLVTTVIALIMVFSHSFSVAEAQTSADIQIVAESNSFVPPTYAGARPISYGSVVTLVALGASRNNYFQWSINGREVGDYSGVGQSRITISLTDQRLRAAVVVSSSGVVIGSDSITIDPQPVELLFYHDHPTRGPLYQSALGDSVRTTAAALDLIAVPYGAISEDPAVAWSINSQNFGQSSYLSLPRSDTQASINASYSQGFFNRVSKSIQILFSNR